MSKSGRRGVTIGDVATAAGVSRATVSRVLNGRPTVDPEIVRRVRATADRLQYAPSATARSLSLGRTQTVALVVPDLANPAYQEVMHGLSAGAGRDGYRVLAADAGEDAAHELTTALEARRRCDALVLCSPTLNDDDLRDLNERATPTVVINRDLADPGCHVLAVDYGPATKTLVAHLRDLGHRRLVYVRGPDSDASNTERIAALDEVRTQHSDLSIAYVEAGPRLTDGYAAAEEVLATHATAAIAFNDLVAFGLLARLNEIGVDVPADVSVAGFDDIEFARYAIPALTTMAIPYTDLGHQAWERLRSSIEGEPNGEAVYFRPRLTTRSSTGPAPWRYPDGSDGGPRRRARRVEWFGGTGTEQASGPTWRPSGDVYVLERGGMPLARYESGDRTPQVHAPRPYLHPVYTTSGVPLTEVSPVDHRHHYGVSVALPDVNGTTFWGGRTFVRDRGPELLANQGRQHSDRCSASGERLVDQLTWYDEHNAPLLNERRELHAFRTEDGSDWILRWTSRLVADYGSLRFASPATEGRPGAGYGGIFWRFPEARLTEVHSEAGAGVEAVHGAPSRWLAVVQHRSEGAVTVVLRQPPDSDLPWFVRAADYAGACPAVAWDAVRTVPEGDSLILDLCAVIVSRALRVDEIRTVYADLESALAKR